MSYEIKNGNIVAKSTDGNIRNFNKQSVDAIISECKRRGVTNKYIIAGILATISKESAFIPQSENLNYSADGLRKTFPSYFGGKNTKSGTNANDYAKKPEKIANYIYGSRGGNENPGDGWKFRGRGFNQITFKSNYKLYGKNIPGLIENPDLLNQIGPAAVSCVAFYVEGDFKSKDKIKNKFGKSSINDFNDWNEALLCIVNMTAGFGNSTNSQVVRYNYDKAKLCHGFLIDYLEKNPQGTTAPPPDNVSNTDNNISQDQENQNDQQDSTNSDNNFNDSPSNGQPIKNLTQFFKPSIRPMNIQFDIEASKNDKNKIAKQSGYIPFVWYNGVQISYQDVLKFNLYHKGILPAIEITILDSWGILREDGFPHDDTSVSIYLNSKSLNLRSINMDFKILDFKDNGNNTYVISGICNIPQIYLRKFLSYGSKTSHETIQEIAKQCELGFCSNINNSDDKMTWINSGFRKLEFIEDVINNSYVSETSFQYCYIDYYYNICYIDLNKELERDVSQDKMVTGFGYKFLSEEDSDIDEETTNLILSNDRSIKESIAYFSKFDIINKSTKVSLQKAYRTRTKYYDSIKKELLMFDIESQTSDGSKSIILKGSLNDEKFFEENSTSNYVGKFDLFDNGEGNVHKNFNYSIPQNRQNLDDITKISCILTLPSNNFNLYVYQKIPIYFSPQKQTPTIQNEFYKRISGYWLITSIEFEYEGGKTSQVVKAIKRELSLLQEEAKESKTRKDKKSGNNNNENNINELSPNDII
jgi:putative chitinase